MKTASVNWLVALSLVASSLAAQEGSATSASLAPGERVRLRLLGSGKKVTGTIESAAPDAIAVRPRNTTQPPLKLTLSQIDELEVARGRRSRWPEGAIIGFVPGALLLGAAGYALSCDDYNASCNTETALVVGLVGGAATAGLGALVGLAIKTDRWVKVPVRKPHVALTIAPVRAGFRAAVTVRY